MAIDIKDSPKKSQQLTRKVVASGAKDKLKKNQRTRKATAKNTKTNPFFAVLKLPHHHFKPDEVLQLFAKVDQKRVESLAAALTSYISTNLPAAFEKKGKLADYRTNPYVLMTSASIMKLGDPNKFGAFLFNSKLYMALETSFGKQVEAAFVGQYPYGSPNKWIEAPEKRAESKALEGLSREEKALRRVDSIWREIDKSVVVGNRRYVTSIKSGPNTINDTQVQGMTRAIIDNYRHWLSHTKETYPNVTELDIVLGLTYGTDRTTNNKENQILVKLTESGFEEEDRVKKPGVLIDSKTRTVRAYRRIGKDFWSFVGDPEKPVDSEFIFLEVLVALAKALGDGVKQADIETRITLKLQQLALALTQLVFARQTLPTWVRDDFTEDQLFWFATAMTAFYDKGI